MSSIYFYYASNGIYKILNELDVKEDEEVLVPAWICDEALQSYKLKNCKLIFYQTNIVDLSINLDDLISKISIKTKLIHIVNNFGILQDWFNIKNNLKQFNIPILEDNAYTYNSSLTSGEKAGTFGDYAVFSFRKVMPIGNGAILYSNRNLKEEKSTKLYYSNELKRLVLFFIDLISLQFGYIFRSIIFNSNINIEYNFPLFSNDTRVYPNVIRGKLNNLFFSNPLKKMSILGRLFLIFYKLKFNFFISKRNINLYKELSEGIIESNSLFIINKTISNGTIPSCFSFIYKNNRDKLFYYLRSKGMPVFVWPTLPIEVIDLIDEFPEVQHLGKNLIQISLNSYPKKNYKKLIKLINEYNSELSN